MIQRIQKASSPGSRVHPKDVKPEIAALNDLANDFVWLASLLYGIGSHLLDLQRVLGRCHDWLDFDRETGEARINLKKRDELECYELELADDGVMAVQQYVSILVTVSPSPP